MNDVVCTQKKQTLKKQALIFAGALLATILLGAVLLSVSAHAAPTIAIDLGTGAENNGAMGPLELLFLFALLALAPSILVMMTSFTRIVIVLSFLRNAMGTQSSPPNQIIIGLALFLTLFIMTPVVGEINTQAYQPYKDGLITQQIATERAVKPLKVFMLKQTQKKDLNLFLSLSKTPAPAGIEDGKLEAYAELGLQVVIPAFVTSELTRAFTMGFLIYLPFLIIDMVVSSTLMSMGMVMLPPAMISMPFKIMMFILVDGWGLLFSTLVKSFH